MRFKKVNKYSLPTLEYSYIYFFSLEITKVFPNIKELETGKEDILSRKNGGWYKNNHEVN